MHEEKLALYADIIEKGLDRLLPLEGMRQERVMEAMRYSAMGGRKAPSRRVCIRVLQDIGR